MTVIPVTLPDRARVSGSLNSSAMLLTSFQELYDTVKQLTKERVGNLLATHGSIHAAAVRRLRIVIDSFLNPSL